MTAVADLPKLEYVFDHILKIDPGFQAGRAQLYGGALASLRPKELGGNPEKAHSHFEQAVRFWASSSWPTCKSATSRRLWE